ncbi:MAG TPA: 30S ribosomal protein S12 methylthiotransferase RimO [Actinomycetota bacterium]|nr:30S ribosomal protein S12 methylthiotransferase RimO [Actinomycetota bacterium]
MSRVGIVTLGCAKNAIDSEGLGGMLAAAGHEVSEQVEGADVVIVNTCGFIDPARRETIGEVLEMGDLKATGAVKGLVVTGCLVARSAEELEAALPEVDALVDFAAYPRIAEIVEGAAAGSLGQRVFGDPGTRFDPAWWDATLEANPRIRFGRAPWAYLKIAEGCDRGCAFCAIPLMRGKFRSRTPDVIEAEARSLVAQGISELSLVSQDSVMWGRDLGGVRGPDDLVSLLARLERIEGVRRLRLMYLHPQGVTDELIDMIVTSEKVVSYFDLSLQHVAPAVLKRMGRWGGRARFEKMIDRIRSLDPLAAVRSTFILGFPGETDEDARAVEDFVEETELDWVGTFTYSPEVGTSGFKLPDPVPEASARERTERVAAAGDRTMERRAATFPGRTLEVLVERFDPSDRTWTGRSHREAPEVDGEIRFASDAPLRVGDYVEVLVTQTDGADLIAKH